MKQVILCKMAYVKFAALSLSVKVFWYIYIKLVLDIIDRHVNRDSLLI